MATDLSQYEVYHDTVTNEIVRVLRNTFSKEEIPHIYNDYVVENMKLPCISVRLANFTDYRQVRPHHSLRYMVEIRFHGTVTDPHLDAWGREKAYKALQALQHDLYVCKQKIHFTSTEISTPYNVTQLLLVFSFFVVDLQEKGPDMQRIGLTEDLLYNDREYRYGAYGYVK